MMHAAMVQRPLTAGVLSVMNLHAQIDGLQRRLTSGYAAVSDRAAFIELIALRGQILGSIADDESVETLAEALVRDAPADGAAFIARARARGRFHRFTEALADLDEADRLPGDRTVVHRERAGVYQAIGRYEHALTIYKEALEHRADFESLGALATLYAERDEIADAEASFDASRECYRGVSPFPLSFLDFQRGHMWLCNRDLRRARMWFEAAVHRLPDYAQAQGHLANVEAAAGDLEVAIARLLQVTKSSDDPSYAAALARILTKAGRMREAYEWRAKAEVRYDTLMLRHPAAFADHAAEFLLDGGADSGRALRFARMNLELRRTPHAHDLFARAVSASIRG